uniref:Elongator complex protein 4 n=1 Tax=Echinococcus granulosus TaxID=6210 RepID=A0A068WL59_ECHGR|nr:elongator complex protein 4 [Echinococcus granulosus]
MSAFETYEKRRPSKMPPRHISGLKRLMKQDCFVTGSGLPEFDNLMVEDVHRTYVRYFLKLFVAQGLIYRHNICFISPLDRIEAFLMDIPDVCHTNVEKPSTDQLIIAWRYQNLPASDMAPHGVNKKSLSNDFDMTSNLDLAEFASIPTLTSCEFRVDSFSSLEENLLKVLEHVEKIVRSEKPSVHRIVIDSIASPLWGRRPRNLQACLANFMVRLRLLLRHSFHVVYITVSKLALQESGVESRWLSYSDYAFKVTGFDGLEASGNVTANPLYGEYNGLLRVLKLPSVSGMHLEPIARPLTLDWAFKVRRKQFILKYLDLPPCLSETVSRSNVAAPHSHCASAANGGGDSRLDF